MLRFHVSIAVLAATATAIAQQTQSTVATYSLFSFPPQTAQMIITIWTQPAPDRIFSSTVITTSTIISTLNVQQPQPSQSLPSSLPTTFANNIALDTILVSTSSTASSRTTSTSAAETTAPAVIEQHRSNDRAVGIGIGVGVGIGISLFIGALVGFIRSHHRRSLTNHEHNSGGRGYDTRCAACQTTLPVREEGCYSELPAKEVVRQSLMAAPATGGSVERQEVAWELTPERRHKPKRGMKSIISKFTTR